jgi:hypothetical protein
VIVYMNPRREAEIEVMDASAKDNCSRNALKVNAWRGHPVLLSLERK